MSRELEFLKDNRLGFLATIDEEGKPRVRAMGVTKIEEGKIMFGAPADKKMCKQLHNNPQAEWIAMSKEYTTLRVNGDVIFEDEDNKKAFIEANSRLKERYSGKEEEFELFSIVNLEYDWYEMKKK